MADYVDGLTDAELRTKLAEFGFPVVPITATTRKVMTKKLKLLIDNKNKTNSEGRRSLAKYSSEEESDTEVKVKRDKSRRATVAAVMQPPSGSKPRKSTRVVPRDEPEITSSASEVKTTLRRTTRVVKPVVADVDFDTGSDSEPDVEIIEKISPPQTKTKSSYSSYDIMSTMSPRVTLTQTTLPSAKTSTPKEYNKPPSDYTSPRASTSSYATSYSTYSSGSQEGRDSLEKLNQIRSRLSLGTSYSRPTYAEPTERKTTAYGDGDASVETPFLSNFTKRLSQLSASPKPESSFSYKNDIIKEHDANGSSYNRLHFNRSRRRDYPHEFKTGQDKSKWKPNYISFGLTGICVAFFCIIFIMYFAMKSDHLPAVVDTSDYILPVCMDGDAQSKPGINCLLQAEIPDALNLLKVLMPELTKRAINYVCKSQDTPPYMTDEHVIAHVINNYAPRDPYLIQKEINNLHVLLFKNPKWGISIIGEEDYPHKIYPMENMDQVLNSRNTKKLAMIILSVDIPWRCYLLNKLYTVSYSLLFVCCGAGIIYGIQKGYKYQQLQQKKHNDQVYSMVEKIIDILQSNVSENSDNYLAVNHVRDMIIPPQDRRQKSLIWDAAVKFLAENESRVRTEVQIVSGEEFHVWRWLGSPGLNTSGSPRSKVWQGQAFETQVGSINSLPCSPTPCLKIRGMFDKSERNHFTIREAVLSKCVNECKILHCEIDSNSDCVYLKCADQKEAAIAYRNLHGWWYDGHLVTVKYLRLERYMQRFPDSPVKGPPFLQTSMKTSSNEWTSYQAGVDKNLYE